MNIVLGGLCEPLIVAGGFGGYSAAPAAAPLYVDPSAGSLIAAAADAGKAEVDPDAGSLIIA